MCLHREAKPILKMLSGGELFSKISGRDEITGFGSGVRFITSGDGELKLWKERINR